MRVESGVEAGLWRVGAVPSAVKWLRFGRAEHPVFSNLSSQLSYSEGILVLFGCLLTRDLTLGSSLPRTTPPDTRSDWIFVGSRPH